VLQNRALKNEVGQETFDTLANILHRENNADHRLRALWALHITGGLEKNDLEKLLNDDNEYIRSWSIQLLCEDKSASKTVIKKFTIMAKNDPSPIVRLYLASALQRIKPKYRWPIAENLAKHNADTADHNIPNILWYGIEPIIADNPEKALELSNQSHIPLLTRHIARRLTVANHLEILVNEIGNNDGNRKLLLLGMRDGLDGQNNLIAPKNWVKVYRKLRRTNDESGSIALQLSLKFGDEVAGATLLETVLDKKNTLTDRQRAIRSLANKKHPDFNNKLGTLLYDDSIRNDIIRAIAYFENDYLAEILLKRYPNFSPDEKLEVIHTLSSRPNYGSLLTQAIDRGDIKRNEVPVYIARILLRIVGNRFLEVWGPIEGISPNTEAKFLKYQKLLTNNALDEANPYIGKQIFKQTCISCHKLYGEGGLVGPDLTGANRTDINYLLGNIVTPNAIIRDDYKMAIVSTDDGMVYSGVVKSENPQFLELRVANFQEPVKIPKSQIMDREITAMSMMPEGLIEHLSDKQIINLFSYLRNLSPVQNEQ
jgi:putative heme-binding domain-containing protein